jgi:AraC-like DNA-binding protein
MRHALEHLAGATVDDAARAAGMSTRTLARRFREETGITWRHFLHTARMLAAMELLSGRDLRVTEVAYELGFDSLSAFSGAFRRFTGENPSEFARR